MRNRTTRLGTWAMALGLVLGISVARAPAAQALPVLDGQWLLIDFSLTGVPSVVAGSVDTLTFTLGSGTTASGLVSLTIELLDGDTVLATNTGVGMTDISAFVEAGSAWTLNAETVAPDLSAIQDGTIDGRIRITPVFDGSPGAVLDAEFFAFTGLQIGYGTDTATLLPPSVNVLAVSAPVVVPEPSAAALMLLLAGALLRHRR